MTDGDCQPASSNWLAHMLEALEEEKDIVLGFGPFVKKKGLLNLFARFENFMTAIQYFSYTLMGNPYMGVGRNLLYRKSVFNRAKGFSDHLNKLGGDDDLLINKMGDHHNTALQFEKESFMYSEAPASWRSFFKQKKRHIGASYMYKRKHQFNLSLFAGSHVLFYVFLFLFSWQISLVFWLTRLIIILALNRLAFSKLGQKDLIIYFPLLDFMIFVYYCIMLLYSILQPKTNSWK
jgi:cellulose synthase/poly-beta-1,6-N-acetylglucosamine synthase-like glycosyltransferase